MCKYEEKYVSDLRAAGNTSGKTRVLSIRITVKTALVPIKDNLWGYNYDPLPLNLYVRATDMRMVVVVAGTASR
jgi:hypothetical protein